MSLPWKKNKQPVDDSDKQVNPEINDPSQHHIVHGSGNMYKESTLENELSQKEVVHDNEILGGANVTREDAMHMGELTPEEQANAKKLRRKIDGMIMPLVMTVGRAFNATISLSEQHAY